MGRAVLNELYVRGAWREEGVADAPGRSLDRARPQETPMARLLLDLAPTNELARGFYDRHGLEPWG